MEVVILIKIQVSEEDYNPDLSEEQLLECIKEEFYEGNHEYDFNNMEVKLAEKIKEEVEKED